MSIPRLDDYVVLIHEQPQFHLPAGTVGVVRGANPFPRWTCEVEFLPPDAQRPIHLFVSAEQLEPIPQSPFDPDPITGQELYF